MVMVVICFGESNLQYGLHFSWSPVHSKQRQKRADHRISMHQRQQQQNVFRQLIPKTYNGGPQTSNKFERFEKVFSRLL